MDDDARAVVLEQACWLDDTSTNDDQWEYAANVMLDALMGQPV